MTEICKCSRDKACHCLWKRDLQSIYPGTGCCSQPYNRHGLAYGIDICAHKAALNSHTPTIGVIAHGLDKIYPPVHRSIAVRMLEKGGLVLST